MQIVCGRRDFSDNCLPTLDFKIKIVNGQVIYSYYEKPMKTPYLVMERSALGEQQKHAIMSNELIRRLSNISKGVESDEKVAIIDQFTKQLKSSGYSRKTAREFIVNGLKGF